MGAHREALRREAGIGRGSGSILERVADYATEVQRQPLAPEVLHSAKRAVIDWFAAMLPGTGEEPAVKLRQAVRDELGHGRAVVYGTDLRAPARVAALLNGAASHVTEFDDIFRDGIYHPGSPTIAAGLAAAQSVGASGLDLLRGIVAGYEISTRISAAINPAHYRYWHTTATVGTFGAAIAAASVRGADSRQFAHAIATAGTMAAGLQQAFRSESMSKPLHAGHAADAGSLAGAAAVAGFTGALDILEGEAGFGKAMGPDPDWEAAFGDLGRVHNITRMTVKNHGCCGHTFAAIDAAQALQATHGLRPEDISALTVHTYGTALKVAGSRTAETPFQAKFSIPFVVATGLVHGRVRLEAFSPERLRDARVRALMQRVELAVDPALDATFPKQRGARVDIHTRDGRTLTHEQPTRKGDPDAPLSDRDLDDKFMELAGTAIGSEAAAQLLSRLHSLEALPDVELTIDAAGARSHRAGAR